MCRDKLRKFNLDDDCLEIKFFFDKELDMYFGEYPDFSEVKRFTPNGRPWVNATYAECPYSNDDYNDCGSCKFFHREKTKDIIGVCFNELLRKEQ